MYEKPDPRMTTFADIPIDGLCRSFYHDYSPGDTIYRKTEESYMLAVGDKTRYCYKTERSDWVYPCDDEGNIIELGQEPVEGSRHEGVSRFSTVTDEEAKAIADEMRAAFPGDDAEVLY